MISIKSSRYRAVISPTEGGRLVSLDMLDKKSIWQPLMPKPGPSPLNGQKATAFPLIPFGGRLRDAKLLWREKTIQLDPYPAGTLHLLHGDGARREWRVISQGNDQVTLALDWPSPDWPFKAYAEMRFRLCDTGLYVQQQANATGADPVPIALGWHPYFNLPPNSQLKLTVTSTVALDKYGFSTEDWKFHDCSKEQVIDVEQGTKLFELANGRISLETTSKKRRLNIQIDPVFKYLVVYAPLESNVIALEPMSHSLHNLSNSILYPSKIIKGEIRVWCEHFGGSDQRPP